ncbi:5-formyltetrahydrofolate cyclo-ligase [Neisseria perflava]|uniref:5-formyltetrahydrofolate cyclo-ligase n=1 Tax=Neisseria perflava TaxID=33053 RepID=UPI0020A16845|nr:5-formyltetrahydrofolate cyclo-ligase [Neisseria perflava]MCP1660475.1 5-formyltetrahydrofolate cyclo-ligase [Neisseria perflava]MCP1772024.1 5-formyltetrahydrofolate cyclo-ligase [Neisseria perflava]
MTAQKKSELRRHLRRLRRDLPAAERAAATRVINNQLKRHIKRGKKIGVYWAIGTELDVGTFIQTALQRGAQPYLPYIERKTRRMWFTPYTGEKGQQAERKRNGLKVYIPQFAGRKTRVHNLDLLLIPLVGIDRQGYRIGQAGGFYDATLSAMQHRRQTRTLGVGFHCQLVEEIPREAHDLPLNGFLSERGTLRFRRER